MIRPPNRKAQPAPIVEPIENTAIASVSRSRGNRSVSIDVAAGDRAASPAPTPTRAVSRCQKFCAVPHSAVEMDQIETPLKMTQQRLKRSDKRREGKEWVGTVGSRWAANPKK